MQEANALVAVFVLTCTTVIAEDNMTFNSTDLILSSRVRVTVVFYDLIHTSDSKRLFPSGEFLLGRSGF